MGNVLPVSGITQAGDDQTQETDRIDSPLDDLLQGVRNGEERPYRELIDMHGPLAYGVALRITGSEADAKDVVQDVFIGLPEALDRFDGGDFRNWLTAVVTRRAYMRLRSDRRRESLEQAVARSARQRSPESRILDRRELEVAIALLPDELRVVFVLKEVEGLSHAEVASTLDISVSLSRVRLFRARRELMDRLTQ